MPNKQLLSKKVQLHNDLWLISHADMSDTGYFVQLYWIETDVIQKHWKAFLDPSVKTEKCHYTKIFSLWALNLLFL